MENAAASTDASTAGGEQNGSAGVDASRATAAATSASTAAGGAATEGAGRVGQRSLRARPAKAEMQLLSEAGGLQLHLDPKRHYEGYSGTGYQGVFDDYWPCGFKKEKVPPRALSALGGWGRASASATACRRHE